MIALCIGKVEMLLYLGFGLGLWYSKALKSCFHAFVINSEAKYTRILRSIIKQKC